MNARREGLGSQLERERMTRNRLGGQSGAARIVRVHQLTRWLALAALVFAAVLGGLQSIAFGSFPHAGAHAARVLTVRDEGRLHYIKSSGSVIIDEGHASGTFPGWVKVRFTYDGEPTVGARFTISGRGGSISARGTARLSSPTSPSPSFHGTMTIIGGTGRYAHVHGGGGLYGVYYRRSYGLTVQAIAKLPY